MFFIAQRFGVSLQALINANPHIANPRLIFPGDFLCVPGPAPTPPPRVPTTCPPGFQGRYTVQPGDTMFFIAQTFGVSLQALINANPHIPNPNLIFPGDVLCVPGVPPVQLPCCLILVRQIPGEPVAGVALVRLAGEGQGSVSVIGAGLPEPTIFGNFNAYAGVLVLPPPVGGEFVFPLTRVASPPGDPASWAGTLFFPVPPGLPILTEATEIQIRPFNTATGATGSVILANALARCY